MEIPSIFIMSSDSDTNLSICRFLNINLPYLYYRSMGYNFVSPNNTRFITYGGNIAGNNTNTVKLKLKNQGIDVSGSDAIVFGSTEFDSFSSLRIDTVLLNDEITDTNIARIHQAYSQQIYGVPTLPGYCDTIQFKEDQPNTIDRFNQVSTGRPVIR